MAAGEIEELKKLHRAVVMTLWAARLSIVEVPKVQGDGVVYYGLCARCMKERRLYVSHIEPVGHYPGMRFDSDNAVPMCYGCHIPWWHKHPRAAEKWIGQLLGPVKRAELAERADARGRRWPIFGVCRMELEKELQTLRGAA